MAPKSLITGISGFVGRHLAQFLHEQGHEVFGFDRSGAEVPHAKAWKADILEYGAVADIMQKCKPDFIFHLAAQSSVKKSFDDPAMTFRVNVEGTKNLLDAVVAAGIVETCRLLIVSSADVYGIPLEVPIKETHVLNPVSPYGKSKLEQEKLAQEYNGKFGMSFVITRSFPHTGPGQSADFVCSSFAQQIALIEAGRQEPVIKVGNLDAERDYTDVRDVVRAYHTLLCETNTAVDTPGVFNVCSGRGRKIADVLHMLLALSKKEVTVETDPARMRPSDIPALVGDNAKLRSATGWKPEIAFEQTIHDLLEWWRKNV